MTLRCPKPPLINAGRWLSLSKPLAAKGVDKPDQRKPALPEMPAPCRSLRGGALTRARIHLSGPAHAQHQVGVMASTRPAGDVPVAAVVGFDHPVGRNGRPDRVEVEVVVGRRADPQMRVRAGEVVEVGVAVADGPADAGADGRDFSDGDPRTGDVIRTLDSDPATGA